LRAEKRRIAEGVHAIKVVRSTTAKMLNEEMEIIGKAEMNNFTLGSMYKMGVDALADAIVNDLRFQGILMKAIANPSLAEQIKTFAEIVQEKANQIKQEATKLSIIAEILQHRTSSNTSSSKDKNTLNAVFRSSNSFIIDR